MKRLTVIASRASCLFAILFIAGCASKPIGYSDFDPGTDFGDFHSFTWISAKPLLVTSPDPVNPALEGILMEEVQAYLTSRGFTFTPVHDDADFVVALTIGAREGMRANNYPGRYGSLYIVGRGWYAEQDIQDFSKSGLVIDIFDRASAEKKWMGWSLREITMSDRMHIQPVVKDAVRTILQHFPPST